MPKKKHEDIRIVIEHHGDFQRDWANNLIGQVQQLVMHRNPLREPYVYAEVSTDDKKTWIKDDSIV